MAEVHSGDVVLVPHGWHGPSMAAPGYDMYYLNVMAGPAARREMLSRDDPDHGWVRKTWAPRRSTPGFPSVDASDREDSGGGCQAVVTFFARRIPSVTSPANSERSPLG